MHRGDEHYMDVAGCSVRCLVNRGRKKELVLLHGSSFTADTWSDIGTLGLLAESGYSFLALDVPGFGKSGRCAQEADTLLAAVIEAAGLDRPVVVGPSMGGRIALAMAVRNPELPGGLVLVGAAGVARFADLLHRITVPTLVVWGGADTICPVANGVLLQEKIAGAELTILEGAPHPCYLEKTDEWHRLLLDYLEKSF